MHLRLPAIDHGVASALWAIFFFGYLWLGQRALGVDNGTAVITSALAASAIFLFVRLRGEEDLRR